MTEPTETTFTGKTGGPPLLRIGIVVGAFLVLVMSAALTMAASPDPSSGTSPAPAASPPASGDWSLGGPGGFWGGMGMGRLDDQGTWIAPDGSGFGGRGFGGRGMGHGGFGDITITAIDGSNLSLKTADGWTRTITVTSSTTITEDGQTMAVGDLDVGDHIVFSQTRNSDGTFTINAINLVIPRIGGTVSTVTSSGFTLKDASGTTWTITVNGSTTYTLGSESGSWADVKAGVVGVVEGTTGTGNTVTATAVHIQPARLAGEVTAKTSSTITITRRDGTSGTIKVDSGTTYQVPGVTSATLTDISVGMQVVAEGTLASHGSLAATTVAGFAAGQPGWGHGRMHGWGDMGAPVIPAPSASPSGSTDGA